MFSRIRLASALMALVLVQGTAQADEAAQAPGAAASAPTSPHTFTGNIGLYNQYVFRGLTQSDKKPAVQGGFDYSYNLGASTFYVGTWGSNISWLTDAGQYASSSLESDWYGGFRGNFGETDFTYDGGFLYYYYPGKLAPGGENGATKEIYGQLGWKWLTAKVSYSVGDSIFAVRSARGTSYVDISANYPIGESGFTAIAHYGKQTYKGTDSRNTGLVSNNSLYSYTDWKLGLSYDLSKAGSLMTGVTIGAYFTNTNAKAAGYTLPATGTNIGKSQSVFFFQKTL